MAHHLGDTPFDDKKSARDHLLSGLHRMNNVMFYFSTYQNSALLTMGEGYHNFHHQYPMDYRNAIRWYQYDPTKWFISTCEWLGLASDLHVFPENEIQKGELTMQLRKLKTFQDRIKWPLDPTTLPIVEWESCKQLHQVISCAILMSPAYQFNHSLLLDPSFLCLGSFMM